jgi:hypothetical protein
MLVEYTIQGQINPSIQIGDNLYFSLKAPDSGYQTSSSFVYSGPITDITTDTDSFVISVTVNNFSNVPGGTSYPSTNMNDYFLFFSKDTSANINRIKGYHANVIMKNDSNEKAELFTVGAEIQPSSK